MALDRIKTVGIQDDAITSAKIGVDVIAAEDLAANSVTATEITNGAVTSAKLDTNIAIAGNLLVGSSSAVGNANANDLELTNSGGSGVVGMTFNVNSGSANTGNIYWRSNAANNNIQIVGDPISNYLAFATSGAEKMRLETGGHLMVGTTDTNPANNGAAGNPGIAISPDGVIRAARTGNVSLDINRMGSDGEIAAFRKDGNTVGRIGTIGSDLCLTSNNVGFRMDGSNNHIIPVNDSLATRDSAIDLGYGSGRFRDLYLSGGVYLGGTGSANHLDDYEEGTWTPTIGGTSTYYNRAGYYIKIGKLVFITGIVHVNAVGTGATNNFQGLPFGGTTGVGRESFIGVQFFNNLNVSATYFALRTNGSQLYGSFQNAADGVMSINPSFITASTEVAFAGSYYTN